MSRRDDRTAAPLRLNMTPMIDVVFQLIVFFLVSMKFKTLDMKVDALLPDGCGVVPGPPVPPPPKIVAVLKRTRGETFTRVKVGNALLGRIDARGAREESDATLRLLRKHAERARATAVAMQCDPDVVRGEVDASPLVPTEDVIRAVDAFLGGGLRDVTFVGTPPPDVATATIEIGESRAGGR